jgi:hypothetical protein
MRNRLYIVIVVTLFTAFGPWNPMAWGFYLSPSTHFTSEVDFFGSFDPLRIDGEYESDYATFWFGDEQLISHFSSDKSFISSIGSINSKIFMLRQSLNLKTSLHEQLDFSLHFNQEKDFESNYESKVIEFSFFNELRRHGWSIKGDINAAKAKNDIGIDYIFRPKGNAVLKTYYLLPKFSHNQRTYENSRVDSPPQSIGIFWEQLQDHQILRLDLRHDQRAVWSFFDLDKIFEHESNLAQLLWLRKKANNHVRSTSVFFEDKTYGETADVIKRIRLRWAESVRFEKNSFQVWLSQHNWSRQGERLQATYIQPKITHHFIHWDVAVSAVNGDSSGSWSNESLSSRTDWRLDLVRNIQFSKTEGSARLLFTFDLDQFGSSETWEGGNLQFQASF